jgi:dimeric dUTPase (all-alpha-NTP-PPase superfamily)
LLHKIKKLLQEIETQMEQGGDDLPEQDAWMLEVNLGNLATSTGEREAYWLLAIKSDQEQARLSQAQN